MKQAQAQKVVVHVHTEKNKRRTRKRTTKRAPQQPVLMPTQHGGNFMITPSLMTSPPQNYLTPQRPPPVAEGIPVPVAPARTSFGTQTNMPIPLNVHIVDRVPSSAPMATQTMTPPRTPSASSMSTRSSSSAGSSMSGTNAAPMPLVPVPPRMPQYIIPQGLFNEPARNPFFGNGARNRRPDPRNLYPGPSHYVMTPPQPPQGVIVPARPQNVVHPRAPQPPLRLQEPYVETPPQPPHGVVVPARPQNVVHPGAQYFAAPNLPRMLPIPVLPAFHLPAPGVIPLLHEVAGQREIVPHEQRDIDVINSVVPHEGRAPPRNEAALAALPGPAHEQLALPAPPRRLAIEGVDALAMALSKMDVDDIIGHRRPITEVLSDTESAQPPRQRGRPSGSRDIIPRGPSGPRAPRGRTLNID